MRRLTGVFFAIGLLAGQSSAADLSPASGEIALSALAKGKELELTGPQDEAALWVRLYKVPADAPTDCTPETEGICAFRYVLTAVEKDEVPRAAVYDLGLHGDVIATKLLRPEDEESVRVRLLILSRPQAAVLQAPAMETSVEVLDVTVGLARAYSEIPAPE